MTTSTPVRQTSVSETISRPADEVWAMVSDITRMGEWSPENLGGTWVKGATGPALGARFTGRNRNGTHSWSTQATVVACEPGRSFGFRVHSGPLGIAEWRYTFDGTEDGCRVTETWVDQRGLFIRLIGKTISGVEHDDAFARDAMAETLRKLKAVAEAPTDPPGSTGS
jgi:hypothetical protein